MTKPVALFDMDGTICDYVGSMIRELEKMKSPDESDIDPFEIHDDSRNQYILNRMDMIKSDENWWANLPKLQLGFDILQITTELGYYNEVLTQAPKTNPAALAGKLRWIIKNLPSDTDFTMTRNKSRHYGRVLVDDYPGFVIPWLEYRKKGLVIMPANKYNVRFEHPQVILYDGTNIAQVKAALEDAIRR